MSKSTHVDGSITGTPIEDGLVGVQKAHALVWDRQLGWIGTDGVNRDTGLEPGQTRSQSVSPGSSPASRFIPSVPIHPG